MRHVFGVNPSLNH